MSDIDGMRATAEIDGSTRSHVLLGAGDGGERFIDGACVSIIPGGGNIEKLRTARIGIAVVGIGVRRFLGFVVETVLVGIVPAINERALGRVGEAVRVAEVEVFPTGVRLNRIMEFGTLCR